MDALMHFVDQEKFQSGMFNFAGTVSLVTSFADDRIWGLTATSVCVLSTDPPLLMVCMGRGTQAYANTIKSRRLCVNVLQANQHAIAELFSETSADRPGTSLTDLDWHFGAANTPVLKDCLVAFECEALSSLEVKTHTAFACAVINVIAENREPCAPLITFRRHYATLNNMVDPARV